MFEVPAPWKATSPIRLAGSRMAVRLPGAFRQCQKRWRRTEGCENARVPGSSLPRRVANSPPPCRGFRIVAMAAKKELTAEQKIEALREVLRHHEHLYYVLDSPEWTDAQYDERMNVAKKAASRLRTSRTGDTGFSNAARGRQTERRLCEDATFAADAVAG